MFNETYLFNARRRQGKRDLILSSVPALSSPTILW